MVQNAWFRTLASKRMVQNAWFRTLASKRMWKFKLVLRRL
jgi:hypothetical protein